MPTIAGSLSQGLAVILGSLLTGHLAAAEKKITVKIQRPPILAAGAKIQLGDITGPCQQELAQQLSQDLQSRGLLTATASPNGSVDNQSVILTGAVQRCEARPLPPILGEGLPAEHISRTEGWFVAVLRVQDRAGKEIQSLTAQGHAQKDNSSQATAPEYPAPAEIKSIAMKQALLQAARLYSTWTESREVPFLDDKECHLKEEYDLAKNSNYASLLTAARIHADNCKPGSKAAMGAWYDLGVAEFAANHYKEAVHAFERAADLGGADLSRELLEESKRSLARLEPNPEPSSRPDHSTQTGMVMSNDLVIKLVQGNVADDEILRMIKNQPGRFTLTDADLAQLRAAKVPDAIIQAMGAKINEK